MALLDVTNLSVSFDTPDGIVHAVNDMSLSISPGDSLAIVGESGSGKTQLAFGILGLLAKNGRSSGSVKFNGQEILNLPEPQLNKIRANEIAMIFQDPMTSLNPYMRVGNQMAEVLMLHQGTTKHDALEESARMLDAVRIPDARSRLQMYPHEFSGGMRQRIMAAMALLCRPKLLIADEPTTALDVTVQNQIMELMADIQRDFETALVLITHDLAIVAGSCIETLVMYGGQVMEQGRTDDLFETPSHPYTLGLLKAVPRLDVPQEALQTIPGDPPDLTALPPGCPFSPRCPIKREECRGSMSPLDQFEADRFRACHAQREDVA